MESVSDSSIKSTKRSSSSQGLEPPRKRSRNSQEAGQFSKKAKYKASSSMDTSEMTSSNVSLQSVLENGGRIKSTKRSASQDLEPPRKRSRNSQEAGQSTAKNQSEPTTISQCTLPEEVEESSTRANMFRSLKAKYKASSSMDTSEMTSSNVSLQSVLENGGRNKSTKRSASQDLEPPRKRSRNSQKVGQSIANSQSESAAQSSLPENVKETCIQAKMFRFKKANSKASFLVKTRKMTSSTVSPQSVLEKGGRIKSTKRTGSSPDLKPPRKRSRNSQEDEKSTSTSQRSITENVEQTSFQAKTSRLVDAYKKTSNTSRADFEAKYQQQTLLGFGGYGSVYAGYRRVDSVPVAIKRIPYAGCTHTDENGEELPIEVAVMLKLQNKSTGSVGKSAFVSLLDWYDLNPELILVLERPASAIDFFEYMHRYKLKEYQLKLIFKQLVDAAKYLEDNNIFHQDIKASNILITTETDIPKVYLIDFGLSCFTNQTSHFHILHGTCDQAPPEVTFNGMCSAGPLTVWQIGGVIFEAVYKRRFENIVYEEMAHRGGLDSSTFSSACVDFVSKCLSPKKDERPTLEQLQRHHWLTNTDPCR